MLFIFASLAALATCATIPTDNALWKVPPRQNDGADELTWQQLSASTVKVDVASDDGRTFSHYPFIYNVGGTLYLLFSASVADVDGMGQDVRIAKSNDAGVTWTKPEAAFPPALLPDQTDVKTSQFWCDQGTPQRALQPLTIVFLPSSDESSTVYAVAQSSDNICPGHFESAGRIARQLDTTGSDLFKGDPCWIETNDYTGAHQWAETIYGTQYGMKVCDQKDAIIAAINKPDNLGPVATDLYNAPIIAGDGKHNVSYPTKAVRHGTSDDGYWQRFWSDVSVANTTGSAWVEYSLDKEPTNWFPYTTDGSAIQETNIYQEASKAHFGAFTGTEQLRYYVSNGGMNAELNQIILTVATSRGEDPAFHNIGIVRGGDAGGEVAAGTRPVPSSGVPGFYWPSAAEVGDKLAVAYSENRQVIWVSVLQMGDLP